MSGESGASSKNLFKSHNSSIKLGGFVKRMLTVTDKNAAKKIDSNFVTFETGVKKLSDTKEEIENKLPLRPSRTLHM